MVQKKLETLTAEQQAMLPRIAADLIDMGLRCEPANREAAEVGVRLAYAAAGLKEPSDTKPAEGSQRLVTALAALPRLPGLGKDRASAVWTKETLEGALVLICRTFGTVAEDGLRKTLDEALTVFATTEVVIDDAGSENQANELDPADLAVANEALDRLADALTREEATVLAGKWIGDSDGDIAARLAISRPTVAKHKESAYAKVRDELTSSEQPIIEYVFVRLQARVITTGGTT